MVECGQSVCIQYRVPVQNDGRTPVTKMRPSQYKSVRCNICTIAMPVQMVTVALLRYIQYLAYAYRCTWNNTRVPGYPGTGYSLLWRKELLGDLGTYRTPPSPPTCLSSDPPSGALCLRPAFWRWKAYFRVDHATVCQLPISERLRKLKVSKVLGSQF